MDYLERRKGIFIFLVLLSLLLAIFFVWREKRQTEEIEVEKPQPAQETVLEQAEPDPPEEPPNADNFPESESLQSVASPSRETSDMPAPPPSLLLQEESEYFSFPEKLATYSFSGESYDCSEHAGDVSVPMKDAIRRNGREHCLEEEHSPGAGVDSVRYTLATPLIGGTFETSVTVRLPQCNNYPSNEIVSCEQVQQDLRPKIIELLEGAASSDPAMDHAGERLQFFKNIGCEFMESFDLEERVTCLPTEEEPRRFVRFLGSWQEDFDGDSQEETMTLYAESTGGSGTFYYVGMQESNETFSGRVFLGDRIEVQKMSVVKEPAQVGLLISYLTQGPDDPFCCPTLLTQSFVLYADGVLQLEGASPSDSGE